MSDTENDVVAETVRQLVKEIIRASTEKAQPLTEQIAAVCTGHRNPDLYLAIGFMVGGLIADAPNRGVAMLALAEIAEMSVNAHHEDRAKHAN